MVAFFGPERWKATLALMAIVAGLAAWMLTKALRETAPASSPPMLALPQEARVGRSALALSPDGSRLIYVAERGTVSELFQLTLEDGKGGVLAGTEGAFDPFFSPDAKWIGFFTDEGLAKVSPPATAVGLCAASHPTGASWAWDGFIYFAEGMGATLMRVPAEGGRPEIVASGESYFWPEALPRRDALLVSRAAGGIALVSTRTGEETLLLEEGSHPRYVSTGHVVYSLPGRLMAVPFDADRLEVRGSPELVVEGVRTEAYGAAQFAVSDGLLFAPGDASGEVDLVWRDRLGRASSSLLRRDVYGGFSLGPNGDRLAVEVFGQTHDIWIEDLLSLSRSRLTVRGNNGFPLWSPDGSWVAFTSDRDGAWNIYRKRSDGTGSAERITHNAETKVPYSISPDRRWLAYTEYNTDTRADVWLVATSEPYRAEPYLKTAFHESQLVFSPNGRWVAYVSDRSGRFEIYLNSFPHTRTEGVVSVGKGEEPHWTPEGNELIYRNGERWMLVPVTTEPTLASGEPRLLFEGDYVHHAGRSHDVAPDGRLLMIDRVAPSPMTELRIVRERFTSRAGS